jgi:hypothetical protein
MKFTVIGDIHATLKDRDKVNHLFDIIEEMGNPTILLGDLLDNKAIIRAECLNLYYKRFKESKLDFIVLVGNHDLISLDSTEHSLETLKELKNVTVVDSPVVLEGMYFVPYIHDLKRCKEVIYRPNGVRFGLGTLFIHQGIVGYDYGNGYLAEDGMTKHDIMNYSRIIAGHFHKFQQENNLEHALKQKGSLTFLGTPYSNSYGESDQIKYIATYDSEIDELKLIETDFPKHKTIEVNFKDTTNLLNLNNKDIYRLILTGTQAEIDSFPKEMYSGMKIVEKPIDDFETNVAIDETSDNTQQFEKWARDIKQLDEETINIGLEIVRSCK